MGVRFTAETLAAVSSLSVGVELLGHVVTVRAEPMYAAVAGGVLIGTGLLVMFRHKASFGEGSTSWPCICSVERVGALAKCNSSSMQRSWQPHSC